MHPALLRRLVGAGHGFNPLGRMSDAELDELARSLRAAGREPTEVEMVGEIARSLPNEESTADLAAAVDDSLPEQLGRGFTSFCFKPNQYIDDVAEWGDAVREASRG